MHQWSGMSGQMTKPKKKPLQDQVILIADSA